MKTNRFKLVILLFIIPAIILGQTKQVPDGTTYYDNHSIRSIYYLSDFELTGNSVEQFFRRTPTKRIIKGQLPHHLVDTLYSNYHINTYEGGMRIYYNDSIYCRLYLSSGRNKADVFKAPFICKYSFKNYNNLFISIDYTTDTSAYGLSIGTEDNAYKLSKYFYNMNVKEANAFRFVDTTANYSKNTFSLGELGYALICFHPNNTIKSIQIYTEIKDDFNTIFYLNFYNDFSLKSIDIPSTSMKNGRNLKLYSHNGKLTTEIDYRSEYAPVEGTKKDGEWIIYNTDEEPVKKEIWQNNKLVKTLDTW